MIFAGLDNSKSASLPNLKLDFIKLRSQSMSNKSGASLEEFDTLTLMSD